MEITYQPDGEKLAAFVLSEAPVVLDQGPRGSGKSTAVCYKLLKNALEQPPDPDGIRRRRTYVVRPTYDQLDRTTIKTWLREFPEEKFGRLKREKPRVHEIRVAGLEWDVVFLAIEDEYALGKLLSAECSDAWVNEFREQPRKLIDDLDGVVGRYPSPLTCHRPQIIADTNAPRADHWFSYMSGQSVPPDNISEDERARYVKPPEWDIFVQPPALFEVVDPESGDVTGYRVNPKAENLSNLGPDYYIKRVPGKTRAWVRVNYLNKPAQLSDGKPVWPTFREDVHVAKEPLAPVDGHPLYVGVDFGRTPAAVWAQRVFDRWRVLGELTAEGGAKMFGGLLKRTLEPLYGHLTWQVYGDPAGAHLAEADDISPFLMFRSAGMDVIPAPTNDPVIRVGAVEEMLRDAPEGIPRFKVSPKCVRLIAAMAGDYQYRRIRTAGENYADTPKKDGASHIADALQYMVVGAGEGTALLRTKAKPTVAAMNTPRERGWNRLRAFRR